MSATTTAARTGEERRGSRGNAEAAAARPQSLQAERAEGGGVGLPKRGGGRQRPLRLSIQHVTFSY